MFIRFLLIVFSVTLYHLDSQAFEHFVRQNALFLYQYQPLQQLMLPLSDTLESLEIDRYTGNSRSLSSLEIQFLPQLRTVQIASWSFVYVTVLKCAKNPKLEQFIVEDHCLCHIHPSSEKTVCAISECNSLKEMKIGNNSMQYFRSARFECWSLRVY